MLQRNSFFKSIMFLFLFLLAACSKGNGTGYVGISGIAGTGINQSSALFKNNSILMANKTGVLLNAAVVEIFNSSGELLANAKTGSGGRFKIDVKPGSDYFLKITSRNSKIILKKHIDKVDRFGLEEIVVNTYSTAIVYALESLLNTTFGEIDSSFDNNSDLGDLTTGVVNSDSFSNLIDAVQQLVDSGNNSTPGDTLTTILADDFSDPVTIGGGGGGGGSGGDGDGSGDGGGGNGNDTLESTITAPVADSVSLIGTSITFTGTVLAGAGNVPTGLVITWSSDVDGVLGTGESLSVESLSDGVHTITLGAVDASGATGSSTVSIRVNSSPVINITAPSNNDVFLVGSMVTFTATAIDTFDSEILVTNLNWSSDIDLNIGTGFSMSISSLRATTHTITLTATDSDGAVSTTSISVKINKAPTSSIIAPVNNAVFNENELVSFSGTGSDAEDGNLTGDNLVWSSDVDGIIVEGTTHATISLSAGNHVISLKAIDEDGATFTTSVNIRINTIPVIVISNPANRSVHNVGDNVTLTGSATDIEDGAIPASSLEWASDLDGVLGSTGSITLNTLSVGDHIITLAATDSDSATTQNLINLKINQAPTATITAPVNGNSETEGNVVTFTGSGADFEDGALTGNSIVWSTDLHGDINSGATFATTSLQVGVHTVTLTSTDSDDATGSTSITFSINASGAVNLTPFILSDSNQVLSGTDVVGEDNDYTINPPSFTDNGNATVTDNVNGLIWQRADDGVKKVWDDAVTYCTSLSLAGQADWRVPNKKELVSLLNYGAFNPATDAVAFPTVKSGSLDVYWSNTVYPGSLSNPIPAVWNVSFYDGVVTYTDKTVLAYARCVRGVEVVGAKSFTDNGDGTATDDDTSLIWQQAESTAMNWVSALGYCEALSLGGSTGWRLPNVKELESLTDDTLFEPVLAIADFAGVKKLYYWSSTNYGATPSGKSMIVSFKYGFAVGQSAASATNYARCVR